MTNGQRLRLPFSEGVISHSQGIDYTEKGEESHSIKLSQLIMDEWIIYKEFSFEAAHQLFHHEGKCRRLHGHSWVGRVYLKGQHLITEGSQQGMLIDYGEIKKYIQPLLDQYLDHYYLNDSTGLTNPTSEEIAKWIFEKLEAAGLPHLYAVEIQETCTSGCRYIKKDDEG